MCCMFSCSSCLSTSASAWVPSVELLVVGVDLALAVDPVAAPLALGAAPPEAPVAAVAGLLPAGRLDQRRAALRADVEARWPRSSVPGVACAVHIYLSNPRNGELNPHFFDKKRRKPHFRVGAQLNSALIRSPLGGRYHGSRCSENRTTRARDRPDHRPGRLRAETPAGARHAASAAGSASSKARSAATTMTTTTTSRRRSSTAAAEPPSSAGRDEPPRTSRSPTTAAEAAGWPAASGRSPTRTGSPSSSTSTSCAPGIVVCLVVFGVALALCFWQNHLLLEIATGPLPGDHKKLITFGVTEPFTTTLTVSAYGALILSLPILLYQLYAYVLPAFSDAERRVVLPILLLAPVLFLAGVAFAYFVVMPAAVKFLLNFNDSQFNIQVRARDYYSFFSTTMLAGGIVFQLPLAILAVTRLGIVSVEQLTSNRRYAYLVIAIVAAALPGVDPVSMLIEMVPLLVLYELSILLARAFGSAGGRGRHGRALDPGVETS